MPFGPVCVSFRYLSVSLESFSQRSVDRHLSIGNSTNMSATQKTNRNAAGGRAMTTIQFLRKLESDRKDFEDMGQLGCASANAMEIDRILDLHWDTDPKVARWGERNGYCG